MRPQIMTIVTAICYPKDGVWDMWASEGDGGPQFELLAARFNLTPAIPNMLQKVVDELLEI